MVHRQKLATFVEEQMTPVGVLGNTHAEAPLHFGGIRWYLLNYISNLVSGRTRWSLLIFVRNGLGTRAGTSAGTEREREFPEKARA